MPPAMFQALGSQPMQPGWAALQQAPVSHVGPALAVSLFPSLCVATDAMQKHLGLGIEVMQSSRLELLQAPASHVSPALAAALLVYFEHPVSTCKPGVLLARPATLPLSGFVQQLGPRTACAYGAWVLGSC